MDYQLKIVKYIIKISKFNNKKIKEETKNFGLLNFPSYLFICIHFNLITSWTGTAPASVIKKKNIELIALREEYRVSNVFPRDNLIHAHLLKK